MLKTKAANRYSCFGNNILLFKKMDTLLFAFALLDVSLVYLHLQEAPWKDEAEVSDTTMLL